MDSLQSTVEVGLVITVLAVVLILGLDGLLSFFKW